MSPLLVVFAKAPVAGAVKTRLFEVLSPERTRQLHCAMVRDLLQRLQSVPEFDRELHTDHPTAEWADHGIRQELQSAGGLGERLYTAIAPALQSGRPAVLVLGGDSPTVPIGHLSELLNTATDVAFGPAMDGGFYAILCRRVHPKMFDSVTWSAATTCDEAVEAARRCGLTASLGPEWYDVDSPGDLQRLLYDPELGPATRATLENAGPRHEDRAGAH